MPKPRVPAGLDPERMVADERFVRAVIRRLVADPHLVEDLTQDTWLAALRHTTSFERAWLGTVARNFVFQALRGRLRRIAREAAVARSVEIDPGDGPLDEDLRRRVQAAVQALEEPYRSAIHLRFFEDLPPTVIAEKLGERPETVRTRIKRGLAQIHALLRS